MGKHENTAENDLYAVGIGPGGPLDGPCHDGDCGGATGLGDDCGRRGQRREDHCPSGRLEGIADRLNSVRATQHCDDQCAHRGLACPGDEGDLLHRSPTPISYTDLRVAFGFRVVELFRQHPEWSNPGPSGRKYPLTMPDRQIQARFIRLRCFKADMFGAI